MAKIVRRRRGSTTDHDAFTGDEGEITVDLTEKTVRVHDGSTVSGTPLARKDMGNVSNAVGIEQLNLSDGTTGQVLSTNGSGVLSFTSQTDVSASAIGGDISGTIGNAQIVAGAVGTPELADNAVVSAKIAAGNVQQTHLAVNSVGTPQIQTNSVTVNELGPASVQEAKIQTGAVTNTKIADNSVTTAKIADANVTTAKILDANVTTAKILDANVTTAKILDANVTTAKIADANVTDVKLSSTGTMPAWDGTALTNLPYDIGFIAGFDADLVAEPVTANAVYGQLVMARTGTFIGLVGHVDQAPNGNTVIDIEKNGTTIYSTKPQFTATNVMTDGNLSVTSFVSGDRITFRVVSVPGTAGSGMRITLKCRV
jgi:uncharacterized protein YjbI with pentapeptide repeats